MTVSTGRRVEVRSTCCGLGSLPVTLFDNGGFVQSAGDLRALPRGSKNAMTRSLSSDIIHCVFTSLPDFATLLSTVLVSKSFHEVFQAHPSSILTSVAKSQIGPELQPCAIRLAHFDRGGYLASRASYVQDFPSEKRFYHDEPPVVAPHVAALVGNDSTVTELELFFSTT